jgi:hypothetical protein
MGLPVVVGLQRDWELVLLEVLGARRQGAHIFFLIYFKILSIAKHLW